MYEGHGHARVGLNLHIHLKPLLRGISIRPLRPDIAPAAEAGSFGASRSLLSSPLRTMDLILALSGARNGQVRPHPNRKQPTHARTEARLYHLPDRQLFAVSVRQLLLPAQLHVALNVRM